LFYVHCLPGWSSQKGASLTNLKIADITTNRQIACYSSSPVRKGEEAAKSQAGLLTRLQLSEPAIFANDTQTSSASIPIQISIHPFTWNDIFMTTTRQPKPYVKAFSVAAITYLIMAGALHTFLSPSGLDARAMGKLFAVAAVPAVITGSLARRSLKPWSIWRIAGTYVVVFLVTAAFFTYGMQDHA
jgi:hypothetical protein